MNDTDVRYDNPRSRRNVERMATEAMSSGTKARKDAKTNARTARAPTPARRVSMRTLGPADVPPELRALIPVWPTWSPGSDLVTEATEEVRAGFAPKPLLGGANR